MSEYQLTSWRDLPSMVVARDSEDRAKVLLPGRFQAAIDEAAMRLGEVGSEDYLAGWTRGDWTGTEGAPSEAAARVATELDAQWPPDRVLAYLDGLGPRGPE